MIGARGITWVGQKHANGCIPACLAMVLGESYEQMCVELEEFAGHDGNWDRTGVSASDVDRLLGIRGYFLQRRYKNWGMQWPPEPFAPIHLVQVVQPSGNQHSVVMGGKGRVWDPLRDRSDLRLTDWPKVNNVIGLCRCHEVERLRGALTMIAEQKNTHERDEEGESYVVFDAHEKMRRIAREALK